MGGLQSLASEYGVNLNVADFINDKPSFYIPDIVNSRILKKAVISNKKNYHLNTAMKGAGFFSGVEEDYEVIYKSPHDYIFALSRTGK